MTILNLFGEYIQNSSASDYTSDAVIVHGSDWDQNGYYRKLSSLPDTEKMNGNCKRALPIHGKNEMYPCFDIDGPNFGYAIQGITDPKKRTLRIPLNIGNYEDPNVRDGEPAINFTNYNITTEDPLTVGKNYTLFRF
eukprot:UN00422